MVERSKIHVDLDLHKDSISVAAAEPDRAPGRLIGKVPHDVNKLLKVLAKVGTAERLHIVYEAGPTGFGLQRALKPNGYLCEIIALSQIRRRPGDRIKTDNFVVRAKVRTQNSAMYRYCSSRLLLPAVAAFIALPLLHPRALAVELDFNSLQVAGELHSNQSTQDSDRAPLWPTAHENLPDVETRLEPMNPSGAMFSPFVKSSDASTRGVADAAARSTEEHTIMPTLLAVLASAAVLTWILRRA